jgi:hypothetical protein
MRKTIISLILLMTPVVQAADAPTLRQDAPDRYVVVPGDTLWGISGRFLQDPWRWPSLWRMNQEQLRNPHRIFPGDVLVLDREAGTLRLADPSDPAAAAAARDRRGLGDAPSDVRGNVVKLSPRTRAEPLKDKAVPTIPPSVIEPFLSRPLIVGQNELDDAPRIMATEENRVTIGAGSVAYAQGLADGKGTTVWQVFRRGDPLVDPESNETLGYLAIYLGEARVTKFGDPSTITITRSMQEIGVGDRLMPATREVPVFAYVPRAPWRPVRGRVVSTYGSLGETGPLGIVALSKGSNDGLEVGHVLAIHRNQSTQRYDIRMSPLYGTQGITGNDSPRSYYTEELTPRDAPLYQRGQRLSVEDAAKLPDERYGLVMVFRTFDRASFGLVMQSSRPVAINDLVTEP